MGNMTTPRNELQQRMQALMGLMLDPYKAPEVRTGAAVLFMLEMARWFCTFDKTEPDTDAVIDMVGP